MTKKQFEAFARIINNSIVFPDARSFAAWMVISVAESDNPRFDRQSFLRACGLEAA